MTGRLPTTLNSFDASTMFGLDVMVWFLFSCEFSGGFSGTAEGDCQRDGNRRYDGHPEQPSGIEFHNGRHHYMQRNQVYTGVRD